MVASLWGLMFPLLFYSLIGFLGYSVYKMDTNPNFLLSFKDDEVGGFIYILTFLSFILAVMMTFPIYFFEAKNIMLKTIDRIFFKEIHVKAMETTKEAVFLTPLRWD